MARKTVSTTILVCDHDNQTLTGEYIAYIIDSEYGPLEFYFHDEAEKTKWLMDHRALHE